MEAVLAATAQHHERLSEQISLDQEKIKIQNLKNSFLLNMYGFCTFTKSKRSCWTIISQGPSVLEEFSTDIGWRLFDRPSL